MESERRFKNRGVLESVIRLDFKCVIKLTQTQPVGGWRDAPFIRRKHPRRARHDPTPGSGDCFFTGRKFQRHLLSIWIPEQTHIERFAGSPSGRNHAYGSGEVPYVEAISAVGVAGIRTLADLHEVSSIFGDDDGDKRILTQEGRIIAGGKLETRFVGDRHKGIEQEIAQTHAFDLGGDALALGRLENVVIDILIIRHAVDGGINRYRLRLGQRIVGLRFDCFRQNPHAE